jgi:LysR family glycine cleavage system transcriptional activator
MTRQTAAAQGVALGRSLMVKDDLALGRLVQPFGPTPPLDWSYYLVSSRTTEDRPQVAALREWILEEIAE